MTKLLQRWQLSSQAEKTLAAECDLAERHGFSGILAKALDGTMFMAQVDPYLDALSSYDEVQQSADYCHRRGLSFGVWVNPLRNDLPTQATMAAECLKRCDYLAFDTEPYAGFMGPYPPVGWCADYMDRIRGEVGTNKPLIWQPDPRPERLVEIRQDEWGPRCTHYAPQDYVTDFYLTPTAALFAHLLVNTRAVAAQYGLVPWTTLPGNADPSLLPADAIQLQEGFVVWRIGSTPAGTLSYLGGIDMGQDTGDPCADLKAKADGLTVALADVADRVVYDGITAELARTTAAGRPATPRRNVLQAIAKEAEAERAQFLGPRPEGLRTPLLASHVGQNIAEGADPHT